MRLPAEEGHRFLIQSIRHPPPPPRLSRKSGQKWHNGAARCVSEAAAREMSQVEPKHIRNSPRSPDGHQNSALKRGDGSAKRPRGSKPAAQVVTLLICLVWIQQALAALACG